MYLGLIISNGKKSQLKKRYHHHLSVFSTAKSNHKKLRPLLPFQPPIALRENQSHALSTIIMMKACNFMCPSAPPRFTTPYPHLRTYTTTSRAAAPSLQVRSFQRGDFDRFADNVKSGKAWRDAWRTANDGFEQFVFEAKKTAERIDREYAVSRRLSSAASSAGDRAREIDREYGISPRVRTLSADFSRNFPKVK